MTTDDPTVGHGGRRLCGAQKRQGEPGETCTQAAGWGTEHPGFGRCRKHGGNTESHVVAAEKERQVFAVTSLGLRRDITPEEALLEEVQIAAGNELYLRTLVQQIRPEALTWGKVEVRDNDVAGPGAGITTTERAGINMLIQLWQSERDRKVKAAAEAIKCGLAARMVKLAEDQGDLIAGCFRRVFDRMGLPAERQAEVFPIVAEELRAIAIRKDAA